MPALIFTRSGRRTSGNKSDRFPGTAVTNGSGSETDLCKLNRIRQVPQPQGVITLLHLHVLQASRLHQATTWPEGLLREPSPPVPRTDQYTRVPQPARIRQGRRITDPLLLPAAMQLPGLPPVRLQAHPVPETPATAVRTIVIQVPAGQAHQATAVRATVIRVPAVQAQFSRPAVIQSQPFKLTPAVHPSVPAFRFFLTQFGSYSGSSSRSSGGYSDLLRFRRLPFRWGRR
jgi:hypothetical protein